jgi:TolB protein
VTDEAYWRDAQKREKTYQEKAADKRPVWIIKADGTEPQLLEVLHYQCAMNGSCAEWKPMLKK